MRNLRANLSPVYYKNYIRQVEIEDQYGNVTGNFVPLYTSQKKAYLCVSPNKGSSEVNQFGTQTDYDRTMTTADTGCEINENSVLWIDGADPEGAYNYRVKKRAAWKNSLQFAIQEVDVSTYEKEQQQAMKAVSFVANQDRSKRGFPVQSS